MYWKPQDWCTWLKQRKNNLPNERASCELNENYVPMNWKHSRGSFILMGFSSNTSSSISAAAADWEEEEDDDDDDDDGAAEERGDLEYPPRPLFIAPRPPLKAFFRARFSAASDVAPAGVGSVLETASSSPSFSPLPSPFFSCATISSTREEDFPPAAAAVLMRESSRLKRVKLSWAWSPVAKHL